MLAAGISGAGYKVAQCAALYARGYHCGIIPADSGMVTKLAPFLGIPLSACPPRTRNSASCLRRARLPWRGEYRDLATRLGYRVTIPDEAPPTWLVHLVLIYFKRLYLNKPPAILCRARPACDAFLECQCPAS